MSTDFVSLKDAIADNKGNFVATVISVGDLKSGTKNGRDWSMKKITVEDATATLEIGCFGDEVKLFKLGCKYEIFPWWKERHEGNPNVGIGKYGQVKLVGTDEIINESDIDLSHTSLPQSMVTEETRGEIGEETPKPDLDFKAFIINENKELAQIAEVVREEMKKENPTTEPNGQIIGLRVKEIYQEWKKATKKHDG